MNRLLSVCISMLFLVGLSQQNLAWAETNTSNTAPLYFAPLPTSNPKLNLVKSQPVANYLSRLLERPVELKLFQSYDQLIQAFINGELHMVELGPLPYLKLQSLTEHHAPLVSINKQEGTSQYNCVLASAYDHVQNLQELKKLELPEIALTQPTSTCGWLVSKRLLEQRGIDLEATDYHYLGSHREVALSLIRKEFHVGGLAGFIAKRYEKLGLKVLSHSLTLPPFTMVANPQNLDSDTTEQIRNALLRYKPLENEDYHNKGFSPAEPELYQAFEKRYPNRNVPLNGGSQ